MLYIFIIYIYDIRGGRGSSFVNRYGVLQMSLMAFCRKIPAVKDLNGIFVRNQCTFFINNGGL